MTQKAQRGLLEINQFQLSVLKPFYVACFLSVIFFAAMCYGLFFFPQSQTVERILVTQCPNSVSSYWIFMSVLSLIFSVMALLMLNWGAGNAQGDIQKHENRIDNDSPLLISLIGLALAISAAMILFSLYQYFGIQDLVPVVNWQNQHIQPNNIFVFITAIALLGSLFALFYWAYKITNKVLGPYERVLRQLDKVIDGRSRRALTVRDGDEMFAELIGRINILMKQREPKRQEDVG